ncbi:MAG TPA: M67 family metallopeptidase [Solirubrobacteraceae bacterium]|jgi:proteasome lid subunit RPN8/RPN11|nr:M67 family metallopeptidase [Solirubrobacteraceae bacterium]
MQVDRALYDELVSHALADAPNECCGIVASADGVAKRVYRATNIHASPLRYEIDGLEISQIQTDIESSGWELGAIYHSHTRSAPYPSQTDINIAVPPELGQSLWPGTIYLIVGVAGAEPEVRGYRIDADGVAEVALSVS